MMEVRVPDTAKQVRIPDTTKQASIHDTAEQVLIHDMANGVGIPNMVQEVGISDVRFGHLYHNQSVDVIENDAELYPTLQWTLYLSVEPSAPSRVAAVAAASLKLGNIPRTNF